MKIAVQIREVYGSVLVYPACATSALFAELARAKTLSHHTLCLIERLGYAIEVETPVLTRVTCAMGTDATR